MDEAVRNLRYEDISEYAREVIAQAPPLKAEQRRWRRDCRSALTLLK
jgi:hypothetical protein